MLQPSILTKLNFYELINSGFRIVAERREDDVELDDEETETDDFDGDNNAGKTDSHEGGERMPDIEDIFKRDEDLSFAECF